MIQRFLDYVEIKTKITSVFAFLITLAYLFYKEQPVRWDLTMLFFASMFLFDLATTAINNYIDTKEAENRQELQFDRKTALYIIYALVAVSTLLGLVLAYRTDLVILLVGGLCFLCGIFYTYGPVPISRQPLGELLSGIFYGLLIPFILLYINMPKGTYLTLGLSLERVSVELMLAPLLSLALLSVAPVCTTANIMLANNVCDLEKDILVRRHTLPYYIGKKSLYLFASLYYVTYVATVIMVLTKILSPVALLSFITLPLVQKNIRAFFAKQEKSTTFMVAIQNYVLIMAANTLFIFLSGFVS